MGAAVKLDPRRSLYLTASDVSATVGKNPWKNAEVVRQEKLGMLHPWGGNVNTRLGHALEPAIISWFEADHGVEVIDRQRFLCDEKQPGTIAATIDGRERDGRSFVEAKLQFEPATIPEMQWGDPYTDEVPITHFIQAHSQMVAADHADVPVDHVWIVALLLYAREFRVYRVDRDPDFDGWLAEYGRDWFRRHITEREPTPEVLPLEVAERVIRKPLSTRPADQVPSNAIQVVSEWRAMREIRLDAEKQEEKLQAQVLGLLGEYEAIDLGLGCGHVLYRNESGGMRYGKGEKYVVQECPTCKVGKMEIRRNVLRFKK